MHSWTGSFFVILYAKGSDAMDKWSAIRKVASALGISRDEAYMTLILNTLYSDMSPWDDRNVQETIEYEREACCVPV